jgi:L-alanine-DL-glutamate epimerase-like enolase superfamily enzyme
MEDARKLIVQLKELSVELIEQPVAANDWESMKMLFNESELPMIADESCTTENEVEKCKDYFHGINIKLTKCSGITPALRMIKKARTFGLQVMIGCMNETTVGTAAIAHLLPAVDYADADGPLLLARDIATGLLYSNGRITVSEKAGLGIDFHPKQLE